MDIQPVVRDDVSAPFFDAARDGVLTVQRCQSCGQTQFVSIGAAAAMRRCRSCGGGQLEWVETEPYGTLISFIVVPGRPPGESAAPPPVVGGVIELAAGPWMYLTIDADPSQLRVGEAVEICFSDPPAPDAETLPYARPRDSKESIDGGG